MNKQILVALAVGVLIIFLAFRLRDKAVISPAGNSVNDSAVPVAVTVSKPVNNPAPVSKAEVSADLSQPLQELPETIQDQVIANEVKELEKKTEEANYAYADYSGLVNQAWYNYNYGMTYGW